MTPLPLSRVIRIRILRACVAALAVAALLGLVEPAASVDRIQLSPTGIGRAGDGMGASVALLGDTAVVGAPQTQVVAGVNSGTVDIYRLQNGVWQSEAMLSSPDPVANDAFGITVALGPDLVVVG